MISLRTAFGALMLAVAIGVSAHAQIRDDLNETQQAAGSDVDKAIAASERNGEYDTKERRALVLAADRWYDCAKTYVDIERQGSRAAISSDKASIAVLSCLDERAKVRELARAYSAVSGTPTMASLKAQSIEGSLRDLIAKRLFDDLVWEAGREAK